MYFTRPEIFQETTVFEFDKLANRVRELAFLNKGLKLMITDFREEEPVRKSFCYEGGIKSYVEHLNKSKQVLFEEPIYVEGEQDGIQVEVAMQYTSGLPYKPSQLRIISTLMKVGLTNQG